MITNETIIKAAKAAGLNVAEFKVMGEASLFNISKFGVSLARAPAFKPLHNDADSAMIMDGAEVMIEYYPIDSFASCSGFIYLSEGKHWLKQLVSFPNNGKAQDRREAVILCAAAKWDAMNEGVK